MINLIKDTIGKEDIDRLILWLKTYPRLTKGKLTVEFEEQWSNYLGCKYSVFVNSGSSANLLMLYVNKIIDERRGKKTNNRVIVPAVSWATDLAPVIQLGFEPFLCDASKETLGLDIDHFEKLCRDDECKTAIVVHVLGLPAQMDKIKQICNKYDVNLLEDSCESIGSTSNGIKTGCFGLMSSFSFYFGHHMSTIEGGMVCTNDKEIYDLVKMVRSHGWDRDLDEQTQSDLRTKNCVNEFDALFTFYVPGFNFRSTDLQAYLGNYQIGSLHRNNQIRYENYLTYQNEIKNDYWKLPYSYDFISNFAYPIIHPNRDAIAKKLIENGVECRPLICGSLGEQPMFKNIKTQQVNVHNELPFANTIHRYGMYVPNHPYLSKEDIQFICKIINEQINI